jgi:hypothetical protein
MLLPGGPARGTAARRAGGPAPEDVPPVELAEVDGQQVLRNARNAAQMLSSPLDVRPDRTWSSGAVPLLDAGVRATAIVDPFGLLATANRCGVAGRIPTAPRSPKRSHRCAAADRSASSPSSRTCSTSTTG